MTYIFSATSIRHLSSHFKYVFHVQAYIQYVEAYIQYVQAYIQYVQAHIQYIIINNMEL